MHRSNLSDRTNLEHGELLMRDGDGDPYLYTVSYSNLKCIIHSNAYANSKSKTPRCYGFSVLAVSAQKIRHHLRGSVQLHLLRDSRSRNKP